MAYSPSFTATGTPGAGLPSRYVGATPGGAPVYGKFEVGDFVIDRSGAIWVCTIAGTPGTWTSSSASALPLTGGTMSGAIAMGSNKITGLTNGSGAQDAAAYGQIPVIDPTATDIQAAGTQAAGNSTETAAANHVHPAPCWTPADSGLLAMNFDPITGGSTNITIAGTVYLMRVNIYQPFTWTNVVVAVTSAGNNTGGSTGTFVGLYSSAGALLSGSSDVGASLATGGTRSLALTTPQALAAGTFVWVALLTNLGTTQPTLGRSGASINMAVVNQSAASYRVAVNGTVLSALPSPSITPASNSLTGALSFWVGAT